MNFTFPYTARQRQMVEHPAKILWCGTATKTGKSAASFCWLIDGLLHGQACAFCGPWFFRSKRAFDEIKLLLEPWIHSHQARVNEARLQITASGGGYVDFLSADNPDCLFGANYDRLVLDESSRMPEQIHGAALTTISATNGKVRCFFNLELGVKNWSIRNLLRVQRLTAEERARTSEDFMCFPSDPALVDPALVETLRSQMPEPLWRALYLAEIPTGDCSLFRNLDKVFTGKELSEPADGKRYWMGVDLARKTDFTQVTIIDDEGHVVACDRFHEISWSVQAERCARLYRTFHCAMAVVDSTGIGDVVIEQLEAQGMEVEAFIFTVPSRRLLIEELVLSCDNLEITIPSTEKFKVYQGELEAFEYQLDGTTVRYAVPSGVHDDAAFSLALAVHGWRASRGAILGVIEMLKRTERAVKSGVDWLLGKPKTVPTSLSSPPAPGPAKAVEATVDGFRIWQQTHKAPSCPNCKSDCTTYISNGRGGVQLFCKQCQAYDGVLQRSEVIAGVNCCDLPLKQIIPGGTRCGNCGRQTTGAVPRGLTFKDLGPGGRGGGRL